MPTLLNINSYHYPKGGADAVYLRHASLMAEAGWDPAFFSMAHDENLSSEWSSYFVSEIEYGRSNSKLDKLAAAGKIIYSLEARTKLKELLRARRPDFAHVHNIYHHISPSILGLLAEEGIPTVLTAHDLKLLCPSYTMLTGGAVCERCKGGRLHNVVAHRCMKGSLALSALIYLESTVHRLFGLYRNNLARVVLPSRFYQAKFQEWGWPAEKLTYIPNFIEAGQYTALPDPGDYFLYFGRLSPEKGVATLLRAAALAQVKLRIAGAGPDEADLRTLAATVGAQVEFLGVIRGEALSELVSGSRCVVLPSEWYENAPMSVLEAFAMGKPVLGADIGGIPEMVLPGETGFLFASGDVEQLAARMRQVQGLPTPALRDMGNLASRFVREKFSPRVYQDAMLELYSASRA
jgi:glycosyltransferase involved in cell wall biosynthesis